MAGVPRAYTLSARAATRARRSLRSRGTKACGLRRSVHRRARGNRADATQRRAEMIIWANLDCEARWGGRQLPQHVARRVSAAAALLAGFAPGTEPVAIYAPATIDPSRIQLPNVTMHAGAPPRWDLAW